MNYNHWAMFPIAIAPTFNYFIFWTADNAGRGEEHVETSLGKGSNKIDWM